MIPFSGLLFFYLLFLGLLPAVVLGLLGKKLHYYGIFLCAAMLVIVFWQNGQLAALALFFLWEMALCCLFWRLPKTAPARSCGQRWFWRWGRWDSSSWGGFEALSLLPG